MTAILESQENFAKPRDVTRASKARRALLLLIGLCFCSLSLPLSAQALAQNAHNTEERSKTVTIRLNEARTIQLPNSIRTVIIGNPAIADVTMLRGTDMAVITAKSFGQTNLLALDASGKAIAESIVRVDTSSTDYLVVQRGVNKESYYCNPTCQPTVSLGDSATFMGNTAGEIALRNGIAVSGGSH